MRSDDKLSFIAVLMPSWLPAFYQLQGHEISIEVYSAKPPARKSECYNTNHLSTKREFPFPMSLITASIHQEINIHAMPPICQCESCYKALSSSVRVVCYNLSRDRQMSRHDHSILHHSKCVFEDRGWRSQAWQGWSQQPSGQ